MWNHFIITQIYYKNREAEGILSTWGCVKALFYPSWHSLDAYSREKCDFGSGCDTPFPHTPIPSPPGAGSNFPEEVQLCSHILPNSFCPN